MEEEFDEFGIPIKTSTENQPTVDEFGIPLKKKDVSESTYQNQELDSKQEVGSSDGVKSDNPVVEFIKNPPVTVSNPESEAGKEYLSIKQEYENRPPMQVNHDDLLARISKLQPQEKKSSLELKIQDVDKVRKEIESTEAKANALARVTGKEPIDILKGNENYKQLKLKETRIKGNDFVTTFGSKLFNGSAGISGTPNLLVEGIGRLLISDEDYAKIPESDRENFFSELLSNIPINNLGTLGKVSISGNKRQKELLKDSEQLREIATKYDSAITEDIGNMDLSQAGKRIAVEGVGSIPSLIQAVIPYVGIASIVTGSASNKLEENKDKKGGITKNDVYDAGINGMAEGLLEVISKGLATKMFKAFGPIAKETLDEFGNVIKEPAKTLSKSLIDNLIYSPLKEGGSEAATEIINKLSDAFVLGNEQDIQENVYQILDSFLVGGFVGGTMGSVTALGENMKLHRKAIDGDVDSQMKVEQINKLQSNIENSKQSIENVNNDENLSEGEKTKIISELENSIKENTSSIKEILGVEVEAKKETETNAESQENTTETEKPTVEETTPKSETTTQEGVEDTPSPTVELNPDNTNETTQAENITPNGSTESGVDTDIQKGQDANIQPTVEPKTNTAEAQPTTIKRVNPKGVKGEFDVEIDENGSVKSIKSKDGRVLPKFIEGVYKKGKKKGKPYIRREANYSRIEAEAIGSKTENAIREEETKVTNDAISSFEPTNEYEAALKSLATGSKVSLKSSNRETRLSQKETKWASGFNKDSDLPSIEALAENIVQDSEQDLDVQEVRNALIDIITTNNSIDNVKSKIIDIHTENSTKQQEEELYQYKNSLSEQDLAKFEAIKAEDDYLSELSDQEAIEYLEEQYGKQEGQQDVEIREADAAGVQERTGEKQAESNTTKEEQSKIDKFEEFLKKADSDLKNFGNETLGINLPIAIARTAVKAMLVSVKTAKNTAQIIKAGVDAIKETSWYKKLSEADKADINESTIEGLIKSSVDETNQMSNEDAKKLYEETVDKADKALEGDKDYKKKRRNTIRSFIQAYSDRQFVPKKLMDEISAQSVKDLMINSHGASGKAKRFFEDSYSKIYDKLNSKDRELLDKFIQLRRIIAIDENRVTKGLPEILHPDGMDMVKAKKVLEQYKSEIGDKKFEDLNKRSDEYFKAYSKLLDDTFKNGLISEETYNSLNGLDYQPRLFIEHITDFEGNVSLGGKSTDKGDTGGLSGGDIIKTLKEGSEGALIRNSEWLLSTSIVARSRAIAMNNINKQFITKEHPKAKARFEKLKEDVKNKKNWTKEDKRFFEYFTELDSKVKINEIVGYKKIKAKKDIKNGEFIEIEVPIFKYDKTPKNFKKAYWYENGVRNEFFLEEGFHDQWFDNFLRLPGKYKEALSYGSGSALIKAIATGNNPAFAIVNTPRDFMYTAVFSDQYSSVVPKAMYQVAKDTFKAIKEIKKSGKGNSANNLFEKYIEYGGDMAFLSTQGRLKKNTELGKIVDKSISKKTRDIGKGIFDAVTLKKLSNYSEIMFRMALFNRTISNELKNRGFKSIDEVLDPSMKDEIYNRAVAEARSLLDFNQGGTVVKDLESVIPYLNTAVQGTRVAADAFAKNPAMVTAKVLQTGAIASTAIAGISIALISSLRSDDDDDKSNLEIYLNAQEGISQYQKLQYFNIVTGQKDEKGEYKIIKVAKNQTMAPIFAFSDNIINHKISDIVGRERKSTKLVYDDIKMAFRNNIMPVDVSSPAGVVTRNPVMKSILTYTTGYDFYRDQPLSNDIGRVEQGAEGQTSSNVDDFYKQIARDHGISAARMKGATESLITTPNTNPFIGLLYSGAEYATTDKDLSSSTKDFAKNFGKSFTKRMVSYTSEFNRTFNKNKEYAEEEAKLRLEGDFRNIDIKIVADQKNDKEISSEEFNEITKKFTPKEKEKLFRRLQDLKRLDKVVDRSIIDIKYEDNSKVRALMIWNRYGDVFDGSKDSQKIIRQMALAKGVLTPEVMLEYNKIKKELNKQKTNPK